MTRGGQTNDRDGILRFFGQLLLLVIAVAVAVVAVPDRLAEETPESYCCQEDVATEGPATESPAIGSNPLPPQAAALPGPASTLPRRAAAPAATEPGDGSRHASHESDEVAAEPAARANTTRVEAALSSDEVAEPEERRGPGEVPSSSPAEATVSIPDIRSEPEGPPGAARSPLRDDLTALAARAPSGGCLVVSRADGYVLTRNADAMLIPASLQKLVLAVAALEILGSDYTFRTTAVAEAAPVDGVLDGDLYLVGGGDPLLSTPSFAAMLTEHGGVGTPLAELASDVVDAGVTRIEGGVIAVEDRFDAFARVPDWPARYAGQSVSGSLNAIAVNQGFRTSPGIASTWGLLPHPTPALRTAVVFDDLLEARAVRIPRRPGVAGRGGDYSDHVTLASLTSAPLSDYLRYMLAESDNTVAETLMKELGAVVAGNGTTRDGALAAHEVLVDEIFLLPVPLDGSGLSPENRLSCSQTIELLEIGGPGGEVASYLAVAGRSGTMENRYRGSSVAGLVRAKTGSLNDVSSIAGFATGNDGRSFTFAVILNSASDWIDEEAAHAFFADLLEILVGHPAGAGNDTAEGVFDSSARVEEQSGTPTLHPGAAVSR